MFEQKELAHRFTQIRKIDTDKKRWGFWIEKKLKEFAQIKID